MRTPGALTFQPIAQADVSNSITGGHPDLVIDATLADVTIAPLGGQKRECICWVLSFKPQDLVDSLDGPATDADLAWLAGQKTNYNFSVVDAQTGERVYGAIGG
ncbi:MAG: hypothetical protein QOK05_1840 [Chloroflexota bacterium]|jgi:hypothetical protein|nr:hypothetical protein [Chloroflexota bacterium]